MTPIFIRTWLMKMTMQRERLIEPVSLRSAWLISRAWRPTWLSPISPSISARGTSAATESTTSTSTAFDRTSVSTISSACSPVSGCDTISSSMSTPELLGVGRVERMLGIDERRGPAALLRLGDRVQRESGLARALRPVDFDHPPARQPADAERDVQPEASGRDRLDLHLLAAAELHCRALAERAIDLGERRFERLLPVHAWGIPYELPMTFNCAAMSPVSLLCKRSFAHRRRPSPASMTLAYSICSSGTRGEHDLRSLRSDTRGPLQKLPLVE